MTFWKLFARNRGAVIGLCILVLIALMALEADYTFFTRLVAFGPAAEIVSHSH